MTDDCVSFYFSNFPNIHNTFELKLHRLNFWRIQDGTLKNDFARKSSKLK